MKILVIQLARLGDILQTWPTLSALRRKYPEAQIDFLVRERFASAAHGNESLSNLLIFPTADILRGIVEENNQEKSLSELSEVTKKLKLEGYDKVINLSYSPFSSYLVSSILNDHTEVKGYARFSDGYLCIPDDVSAYFYAQVGTHKSNRVHLTQIFSGVADVELEAQDWNISGHDEFYNFDFEQNKYILVQIGASQPEKTYGAAKWAQTLGHFKSYSDTPIVLIGSADEKALANEVLEKTTNKNIVNLVGETELNAVIALAKFAKLAVCNDSMLVHICSLTDTPTLNVSLASVNFWETGPLATNSRIVLGEKPEDIASDRVALEINSMLSGKVSGNPVYNRVSLGPVAYEPYLYEDDTFCWEFIEALYMQGTYPQTKDLNCLGGIKKLNELSILAIQQLNDIDLTANTDIQMEILSQVDTMLEVIPKMVPSLEPLVDWFQTERTRIGPLSVASVLKITKEKFQDLRIITSVYIDESIKSEGKNANSDVLK